MTNAQLIGFGALGLLIIYQLWVTMSICRADDYDSKQRNLQCLVIWLVPLFGALTCQLVLRSSRVPSTPANTDFVPQSDMGGIGPSSATD